MAMTVKKLYVQAESAYSMKLIAGENGLNNWVSWTHILEEIPSSEYLEGGELVFTTGIISSSYENWFIDYVHNLKALDASALIVNIGPSLKSVPQEVIDYCDSVNLPVFTIPWRIKIRDITKDFCQRILYNDQLELSVVAAMKNVIFKSGSFEEQVQQLGRYACQRDSVYCFMCIECNSNTDEKSADSVWLELRSAINRIAGNYHDKIIEFMYKDIYVFAMVDFSDKELQLFINDIETLAKQKRKIWDIHAGFGENMKGLENQPRNFENALSALDIAKKNRKNVLSYNQLGIYKILLSVQYQDVLTEYYENTLGKLEDYDKQNGTNMYNFLKVYLENNGSPQIVSEKLYIHRNTVNNQLKRVGSIIGYDPFDLEDRMKLYLAYLIHEII